MTYADPTDRYTRGLAALSTLTGTDRPKVLEALAETAPDLARLTVEFGYGDVWTRPGLTPRQRQIVTISALAALGNAAPQLRFHIGGALNAGCSRREIVETFIHATVYAGFPAALNALTEARAAFADRPAGTDPGTDLGTDPDTDTDTDRATDKGPVAAAPSDDLSEVHEAPAGDRYHRGLDVLREVDGPAGVHVVESLRDLAPGLARYVVEHVFGDVYTRGGLDLHTRELASVAMCAALGTAAPQLRVHLRGFLNVGGTREEIVETMTQMAVYAGFPAALNGIAAASEIFAEAEAEAEAEADAQAEGESGAGGDSEGESGADSGAASGQ